MAWLYVPLDVNYAENEKIIDAGPMGELLYVRSLAFAKRAKKDGHIRDNQMHLVTPRIPRPKVLSERLLELGLWERNGAGIYLTGWLERNELIAETSAAKSSAGALGNHVKWGHEEPGGKPTAKCSVCVAKGLA